MKKVEYQKLDVDVYETHEHIIIVGNPGSEDESHNCDVMGCGFEHVLYKFRKPVKSERPTRDGKGI